MMMVGGEYGDDLRCLSLHLTPHSRPTHQSTTTQVTAFATDVPQDWTSCACPFLCPLSISFVPNAQNYPWLIQLGVDVAVVRDATINGKQGTIPGNYGTLTTVPLSRFFASRSRVSPVTWFARFF
jgi:hypothetical protein